MSAITTGGSGNWSSTTNNAPWAGGVVPDADDTVIIANGHTVTIDESTTTGGTITIGTDTTTAALNIAAGGKLEIMHSIDEDWIIEFRGDCLIYGTLEIGTVAEPIPAARKVTLELNKDGAAGDYGLIGKAGGTVTIQGASLTFCWTLLASDAAINATSLTTADSTGWKSGDEIAIASTSRTSADSEAGDLNGDASGTTLTVHGFAGTGGGLAVAHLGTSPTQAEIINLTRNIKIVSDNTAAKGYVYLETTCEVDIDWIRFSYLGSNAAYKYGVTIGTTTGHLNINGCSGDNNYSHFNCGTATLNNWTITKFVGYVTASYGFAMGRAIMTNSSILIDDCVIMDKAAAGTYAMICSALYGTVTHIRLCGCNYGFNAPGLSLGNPSQKITGDWHGFVVHSGASMGFIFGYALRGYVRDILVWRMTNAGIAVGGSDYTIEDIVAFGNGSNISLAGQGTIIHAVANGDSTFASSIGVDLNNFSGIIIDSDIGTASGIKTTHGYDISVPNAQGHCAAVLVNTILGSGAKIRQATLGRNAYVAYHKLGGSEGADGVQMYGGQIEFDSTAGNYKTDAPSIKMIPAIAAATEAYVLDSAPLSQGFIVPIDNADTITVTVWVKKSTSYNGSQPRLVMRRNDIMGITADTVGDTMTEAVDTWEQLTYTTAAASENGMLEFIVQCDGTAGYVNVSEWAVS
jgi:hypothetical protein